MSDKLIYVNKNWGKTAAIGSYNDVSIHQAYVESGQSSIHYHDHYFNVITSIDAIIKILFFDHDVDKEPTSSILLRPGGKITIKPKRIHQFVVESPGYIVEIYYTEHRELDIVRLNG